MFAFNLTEIGSNHIRLKIPCQDFSLSKFTDDYAIGIVADGHGSRRYLRSERGSKFAAVAAIDAILLFLQSTNNLLLLPSDKNWQQQLASSILVRWYNAIETDFAQEPLSAEELSLLSIEDEKMINEGRWQFIYGTTLLIGIKTSKHFIGFQIGDGKCVAIDKKGICSQPIPWDDDCFLNQTTSLCDADAINRFRFVHQTSNVPEIVFLASDGVDDSYPNDRLLYAFYQNVYTLLKKDKDDAINIIKDYLPQLTLKGSHDDISIAGIK